MTNMQKTARKTAWDVIGIELAVDLRPDAHKELLDGIARSIMDARDKALEDAVDAVRDRWCPGKYNSLTDVISTIRAIKSTGREESGPAAITEVERLNRD